MAREILLLLCAASLAHGAPPGGNYDDANKGTPADVEAHRNSKELPPTTLADGAKRAEVDSFMRLVRGVVEATAETGAAAPLRASTPDVYPEPPSRRVSRKIFTTRYTPEYWRDESLITWLDRFKKSLTTPVDQDKDLKSVLSRSVLNFIMPNKQQENKKFNMGSGWQILSAMYKTLNGMNVLK
ncbi:uncharacterized protein LOC134533158 isoform X2 [Bacillus rossius redtenbacheri]|uniref:uncharacterized protein LOC134533158 isoform X2 n=1 Tax=Bacillus rossius redtenbacheri TaxID=93214 RepID=UPI002FDDA094